MEYAGTRSRAPVYLFIVLIILCPLLLAAGTRHTTVCSKETREKRKKGFVVAPRWIFWIWSASTSWNGLIEQPEFWFSMIMVGMWAMRKRQEFSLKILNWTWKRDCSNLVDLAKVTLDVLFKYAALQRFQAWKGLHYRQGSLLGSEPGSCCIINNPPPYTHY